MWKRRLSQIAILLATLIIVVVVAAMVAARAGVKVLAPLKTATVYPWSQLAAEADTANHCVSCHKTEEMHTCKSCHDAHGSIEMEDIPFNVLVQLAGDVPEPGNLRVNEILPYADHPDISVSLSQFLRDHGVEQFESVTLASGDGAAVTVEPASLSDEAVLLPHMDGMRFAAENLHISTWLKGVTRIVVVGVDKPLTIDGEATSIGRLLLGATASATIEQTDVMLKSEDDGQIRKAKTASRVEGAPLEPLLRTTGFTRLLVRDKSGRSYELSTDDAQGALIAQMWGETVLVLPQRGRGKWVANVVEITSH